MLWEKKMEIELEKAIYVKAHQNPPCPFWVSEAAPMVDEDWDKNHWKKMHICKYLELDEVHLRVHEWAGSCNNEVHLSIIEKSWDYGTFLITVKR